MLAEKYLPAARNRHIMEAVKKEGDSLMKITNSKTDICANRFGGNGDVIIEHYLDESMLNDSVVMYAKVTLKPAAALAITSMTATAKLSWCCRELPTTMITARL